MCLKIIWTNNYTGKKFILYGYVPIYNTFTKYLLAIFPFFINKNTPPRAQTF